MNPKPSDRTFRSLEPHEVRWSIPDDIEVPESTAGLEPSEAIIGQPRALKALQMGLELYRPGYNVFVAGISGTGRTSTVKRLLSSMRLSCARADDLCYVHDFDEPERPRLITLPRGTAPKFRQAVHENLKLLRQQVDAHVNADATKENRKSLEQTFREESSQKTAAFQERVESAGFALAKVSEEVGVLPELVFIHEEKGLRLEDLDGLAAGDSLDAETIERVRADFESFQDDFEALVLDQQRLHRELIKEVNSTERAAVKAGLRALAKDLLDRFGTEEIKSWLKQVEDTILDNLEVFRRPETEQPGERDEGPDLSAFDVNVVLTNKGNDCPVVVENNPNWQNLFGSQDRVAVGPGVYGTDFSRIKPGSLLRAQGGYLILNATDVLTEPLVWNALKRVLRSRELVIQPPDGAPSSGVPLLNPDPIELNVKVVLVGHAAIYETLYERDHEFAKIFKVKAEFDSTVAITQQAIDEYLDVVVHILREEKLRDLDAGALAQILAYSTRLAGRRQRLSTQFSLIADTLRESDYLAGREGSTLITRELVAQANRDRRERMSLYEERIHRRIDDGDVLLQTDGTKIGQINGLTVLSVGEFSFGLPSRISGRVAVGKAGFVDVEREVELTGSTYEKGTLIIEGFMNGRFATRHALTLCASICFEQSYSYVDGDSASSTEIYVLLSALSGVPLRQDVAVTGSVDQFGQVQAVGGANEKIEGFFDVCAMRGLTGSQGVMIPASNVDELTLSNRVVAAIREGNFSVWPVATIDEGIEHLTGVAAGEREADGWTPGSINDLVQKRLAELHQLGRDDDNDDEDED